MLLVCMGASSKPSRGAPVRLYRLICTDTNYYYPGSQGGLGRIALLSKGGAIFLKVQSFWNISRVATPAGNPHGNFYRRQNISTLTCIFDNSGEASFRSYYRSPSQSEIPYHFTTDLCSLGCLKHSKTNCMKIQFVELQEFKMAATMSPNSKKCHITVTNRHRAMILVSSVMFVMVMIQLKKKYLMPTQ